MFSEPKIVSTNDLTKRAYVKVYVDGERFRFYNGKLLSINCNPNRCSSIKERNRLLTTLAYTLRRKIEAGWKPSKEQEIKQGRIVEAAGCIQLVIDEMLKQDLSTLYKRDVEAAGTAFISYLKAKKLSTVQVNNLDMVVIEGFLKQFNHSSTYYMNKRRTLGGIFSRLVRKEWITVNPVSKTVRLKEKATLHEAYPRDRMLSILEVLKSEHPNLYLCALLMYGCFLRPHQEIRLLLRKHLNQDCSVISLGGGDNKSGKVRTVFVPDYVRNAILERNIHEYDNEANLFTGSEEVFNECYFNTCWSRIKEKLLEQKLLGKKHTLYSFRHTGAINMYKKTKDLHKVQQAMGHSSMTVTLTYMRSLGLINSSSPEDAPEL